MTVRKNKKWKVTALAMLVGATALYFYTLNKKQMDTSPKNEGTLDKIIFGLLIGGAIGSVLGLSVAPSKGSELRSKLKVKEMTHGDAVSVVSTASKGLFSTLFSFFNRKKKATSEPEIIKWIRDGMAEIPFEK